MMINNVTFTGGVHKQVQDFMTTAAHEYLPAGKIFNKSEVAFVEEAVKTAKAAAVADEVEFFNHRGNNVIDETVTQLQDLAAARSYAQSHGVQVAEELTEEMAKKGLKTNA